MISVFSYSRALRLAAAALLAATSAAHAGEHGERRMPVDMPPSYVQECAGCHTAYPPGMLPRVSWQRIMSGLERHYGTDASIDAATARQLDGWLQAHAGTGKRTRAAPPEDRLTRSAWFERKHRKIDPAVWKLSEVGSAANCAACHTRAEQGDYDEHSLRMPAGLTAQQRRAWRD